jgi:serine/threonine-protein kinase RsbT
MGKQVFAYSVVRSADFEDVGVVSTEIKKKLEEAGVERETVRRVSVICFEGEMNLALYTERGGNIQVIVEPDKVDIYVEDDGPGIEDLEKAMQPGYSTAPLWVHEMGFGAGMGLPNMKRNSDVFEITSEVGKGTRIHSVVYRRKKDAA